MDVSGVVGECARRDMKTIAAMIAVFIVLFVIPALFLMKEGKEVAAITEHCVSGYVVIADKKGVVQLFDDKGYGIPCQVNTGSGR